MANMAKDIEKTINILATQLEYHKALLRNTCEMKTMLSENCVGDLFEEKVKERGLLINNISSSKKYFDSVKECLSFADNIKWKPQANDLLQQIQQSLDATVSVNAEIVILIKQCIKEITFNLEKIQDGKHLLSDLGKHISNTPSFVDVCG